MYTIMFLWLLRCSKLFRSTPKVVTVVKIFSIQLIHIVLKRNPPVKNCSLQRLIICRYVEIFKISSAFTKIMLRFN